MTGHVYKITNQITGKEYVGFTTRSVEHRFKKHKSMVYKKGCSALYRAMEKYGKENFTVQVLFTSEDLSELKKAESEYIISHRTLSPHGYNLTTGGEHPTITQEARNNLSKSMKGRKILWKNKVSEGVKKLWENEEYRERQTKQRHEKRGKYRKGITRLKLRKSLNIKGLARDYRSFMIVEKVCKKYQISMPTLYKIIEREGIQKRGYSCHQEKA